MTSLYQSNFNVEIMDVIVKFDIPQFLDSLIPRGVKSSKELPSLVQIVDTYDYYSNC